MSSPSLFEKIIAREIPAEIVYEDDFCLCFRDIAPQAPTHLLLVPKKRINRIQESSSNEATLLGHMMTTISKITEKEGIAETGYRVVINNGADGGESVPHLHLHILGGRPLLWPPG